MITNFLGILGRERAPFDIIQKQQKIILNKRVFYLIIKQTKKDKIILSILTSGWNDNLFIERKSREGSRFRASSNDDILGIENLISAVVQIDWNCISILEFSPSLNVVNFVLLEESLDSFSETCHNRCFLLLNLIFFNQKQEQEQ